MTSKRGEYSALTLLELKALCRGNMPVLAVSGRKSVLVERLQRTEAQRVVGGD